MKKLKVAVIYGGRSGEHEVSCLSAASVIANLDRNLFEPIPIGIDKSGRWMIDQEPNVMLPGHKSLRINHETARELPIVQPSTSAPIPFASGSPKLFDVAFPVVHGVMCEDGTLQGLLELLNVPYVGANVLSSAVGMDKDVSKRLVNSAGIPVPPFMVIRNGEWLQHPKEVKQKILKEFSFPLFVKPCNTGSSVGIEKARTEAELEHAIATAFSYDQKIIIERALNIRDIEFAVLEGAQPGDAPRVSVGGEILLTHNHEFYSYTAKYQDVEVGLEIPAQFPEGLESKLQAISQEIFLILECEGMARVDLFLERDTNQIYFNEVNTLPGFTPFSMYPKLWEASGLDYQSLLTELVRLAVSRFERKQALKRDYK